MMALRARRAGWRGAALIAVASLALGGGAAHGAEPAAGLPDALYRPAPAHPDSGAPAVRAWLRVVVDTPAQPAVRGTTNLPDGAQLQVFLRRPGQDLWREAWATVSHGSFASPPLLPPDQRLLPGQYAVEVVLAFGPGVQPEPVEALLGPDGKRLDGPQVQSLCSGCRKFLYVRTTIAVPADDADAPTN